MVQPLEWSVCIVCVAHARTSMPHACREGRGGHLGTRGIGWHGPVWALAGPAAASLPTIMAAPALAMGAAGEASGSSFDALSSKMNVPVHDRFKLSQCTREMLDLIVIVGALPIYQLCSIAWYQQFCAKL